jgi:hypothetical protein
VSGPFAEKDAALRFTDEEIENAHEAMGEGEWQWFQWLFREKAGPLIAAAEVKAWRDAADKIATGPTFPLMPSILSALLREHADALEAHYATRDLPPGEGRA